MGNDVFDRGTDEFTVTLGDGSHDAMSTDFGIIRNIRRITIGHGETCLSDDSLYIHIDGDATRICVSELSYNSTFVTAVAFADFTSDDVFMRDSLSYYTRAVKCKKRKSEKS